MLLQDLRSHFAIELDELENGVFRNLRATRSIVHQSLKARVGFAEDSVAITGHNPSAVKGRPEVIVDILLGVVLGNTLLHLDDPAQDLLSSQTKDVVSASY
jgi:hypothetical protein